MNSERRKLEIGGKGFACFALYAFFIWLCDAFDLFCFFVGLPQTTLISRGVIAALLILLLFLGKGRICFRSGKKADATFFCGAFVILGFCVYKGIIPDLQTDVMSYHLLVQNPGFQSMTSNASFMAGDFQYYGFRWADRLFYAFRKILGYRIGTLLGGIVNVLLYAQMRDLIHALYGDKLEDIQRRTKCVFKQSLIPGLVFSESVLAFAVVMTYDLLLQSGGYMVDCIGIPFILEAVHILLTKDEQNSGSEMAYYALLCGCFFAMKMTHIVYVAPMILVYLAKYKTRLTLKRFTFAFCIAIIPVCVYLLYAYADTGNPVFPYFNTFFRSPYFNGIDFKDTRWGPQNIKETIAWPLLSAANPQYRVSEIPNAFNTSAVCLMAALFARTMEFIIERKENRNTELLLITLGSAYLWACSTGHGRYYIFGYMLAGMILVEYVINAAYSKNRIGTCFFVLLLIPVLMQPMVTMKLVAEGREWSWRSNTDKPKFSENLEYVFKDQQVIKDELKTDASPDMVLMNMANNGSIANTLYPNTPVVYNRYLKERISDLGIQSRWNQRIDEALEHGNVYEIMGLNANGINWNEYLKLLNEYGLRITEIEWPQTVFVGEQTFTLFKLEKAKENESNSLYVANEENNCFAVPNQRIRLSANVILSQCRNWESKQNTIVSLKAKDKEKTVEVYSARISERMTVEIDEVLDLSGFGEDVVLMLEWRRENGESVNTDIYDCLMINLVIEEA